MKNRRIKFHASNKQKKSPATKIIGSIFVISVFALTYFLALENSNIFTDAKTGKDQGEITDAQTPATLSGVSESEDTFTMEWLLDSMDRGNHDLDTSVHGDLIVAESIEPLERGDILYYQIQGAEQLGRIIGLPGETVEIQEGQVFIDHKKLNTFYGAATSLGLTKDEYFEKVDAKNVDIKAMEEYFSFSMKPVSVEENSVFVLVDMWWRGKDSREYGSIPLDQVQGKVLGHQE